MTFCQLDFSFVFFSQVRWKGYGSDEDSWEPEWNLETARLILDEYISIHGDEVKKAQDLVLNAENQRKRRGRQTKLQNKVNFYTVKYMFYHCS